MDQECYVKRRKHPGHPRAKEPGLGDGEPAKRGRGEPGQRNHRGLALLPPADEPEHECQHEENQQAQDGEKPLGPHFRLGEYLIDLRAHDQCPSRTGRVCGYRRRGRDRVRRSAKDDIFDTETIVKPVAGAMNDRLSQWAEMGAYSAASGIRLGRRSSPRAWRTICQPPLIPSAAMTAATMMSGQPAPEPKTPAAASSTALLPMASLREQIQTERILASPPRKR